MRRALACCVGLLTVLAGCGFTAEDVARVGTRTGDTYEVRAMVSDVLNLTQGAPVRVGGVDVGKVSGVAARDYRAQVVMDIEEDFVLREGSTVRLRYTTALGEMYVQVEPAPEGKPLGDGALIPPGDAATAPTVEDSMAAASLLINGGSLGQIQTIVEEINTSLEGRTGTARSLMRRINTFLTGALESTREIDRILDALAGASVELNRREATVNRALREIEPAAKTLTDNTDALVALLRSADAMARQAQDVVGRTRSDLVVIAEELGPVLDELYGVRDRLVPGLDQLARLARSADRVVVTDYLNLYFLLHATAGAAPGLPGPGPDDPGVPGLPDLPGVPDLPGAPDLPGLSGLDLPLAQDLRTSGGE